MPFLDLLSEIANSPMPTKKKSATVKAPKKTAPASAEEFGYSVKYVNKQGHPTNVQTRGENAEQDAKDLIKEHGNGSMIKIKF
jgi:hypothetical protein